MGSFGINAEGPPFAPTRFDLAAGAPRTDPSNHVRDCWYSWREGFSSFSHPDTVPVPVGDSRLPHAHSCTSLCVSDTCGYVCLDGTKTSIGRCASPAQRPPLFHSPSRTPPVCSMKHTHWCDFHPTTGEDAARHTLGGEGGGGDGREGGREGVGIPPFLLSYRQQT